jgi:hypothetical protein
MCIICEDVPCTCYAKKKAPKKIAPPEVNRNWGKTESPPIDDGFGFEMDQAIRNLDSAGLLTDVDRSKYRDILNPRPNNDTDRQLADWRKRNGLV